MKKVIVLGAGLVGKEMAIDLSGKFDVTAVDINEDALDRIGKQGVKTQRLDFTNEERLKSIIAGADLVVGAVPGFLGFQTVKRVIESGKNMVRYLIFSRRSFRAGGTCQAKECNCGYRLWRGSRNGQYYFRIS